jgi:hypothetical protein
MKKKKLTKAESKKLWLEIIDELLKPMWDGVDMSSTIEKLKRVKFTYGGEMVTTRGDRECPHYRLARWGFPSIYNMWKVRKEIMEDTMSLSKEIEERGRLI